MMRQRPNVNAGSSSTALRAIAIAIAVVVPWSVIAQQDPHPTFRAGVSRVSLSVVVRDARGRPVTGLSAADFQVFDEGHAVAVSDFRTEDQPVSISLLIDTSGSMRIGGRLDAATQAAEMLLASLQDGLDEVGVFTFDRNLHEVAAFASDFAKIRPGLKRVEPFGSTAIHDAIAAAARKASTRPRFRRAVVVLTDGVDTSSDLSAAEASNVASVIDVPVYILSVDGGPHTPDAPEDASRAGGPDWTGRLDDLTRWTGGALLPVGTPAVTSVSVRQIVTDLRSGYLMAFAPRALPGWHRITVRVSRASAVVRTRAGFWVGTTPERF